MTLEPPKQHRHSLGHSDWRSWAILVWLLIGVGLFLSFPISWNVRSYFTTTRLMEVQYGGWIGLFRAWDVKPIGNRMVDYPLYLIAKSITGYENKPELELVLRLVYLGILLPLFSWATTPLQSLAARYKIDISRPSLFGLLAGSVVWSSYVYTFEAEEKALLMSIFTVALLATQRRGCAILAGVLMTWIFVTKIISALLLLQILMLFLPLYPIYKRTLWTAAVTSAVTVVLFVGGIQVFAPVVLEDVREALLFQQTFRGLGLRGLVYHFFRIPAFFSETLLLLPGWFALGILLTVERGWRSRLFLATLWGISVVPIWLQAWGFPYHFIFVIFPALVSSLWLLKKDLVFDRRLYALAGVALLLFAASFKFSALAREDLIALKVYLPCLALLGFTLVYSCCASKTPGKATLKGCILAASLIFIFFQTPVSTALGLDHVKAKWQEDTGNWAIKDYRDELAKWEPRARFLRQVVTDPSAQVLYLDPVAAYYLGNPTYLKQFFPLPLGRVQNFPELKKTGVYLQTQSRADHYTGPYVVDGYHRYMQQLPGLQSQLAKYYETMTFDRDLCVYVRK